MLAGVCAEHSDRAATFTCARCGDNGCDECARRVVPTAAPICAACWRRREERVTKLAKDDGSTVCWAALGFGVLALIPCIWPAQLGAVILGGVGVYRSEPGTRPRMMAWIGGALGLLGIASSVLGLAWVISTA